MKRVGQVPRVEVEGGALVRLPWPPFDVLVAWVDGEPSAIEDACNHAGASLAEGVRVRQRCVSCPMHGYVFDLVTGRLVEPKGLCDDQRRLVAQLEGDEIVVWDPGPPVAILGP